MRTTSIVLDEGRDEVWRFLTLPELMAMWMPNVDNLHSADGGPLESGSILRFDARGATHESHVTAMEAGVALELTSTQGAVTAVYRYALSDADTGTRLALSIDCRATGALSFLSPVIGLVVWLTDKSQPEKLKAAMRTA